MAVAKYQMLGAAAFVISEYCCHNIPQHTSCKQSIKHSMIVVQPILVDTDPYCKLHDVNIYVGDTGLSNASGIPIRLMTVQLECVCEIRNMGREDTRRRLCGVRICDLTRDCGGVRQWWWRGAFRFLKSEEHFVFKIRGAFRF